MSSYSPSSYETNYSRGCSADIDVPEQVTNIERPVCSIINSTGICGVSSLNTANCSLYAWAAMAEVTFSGTTLQSISTTAGSSVVLVHDNITNLLSRPVTVNITGDCCYPTVHINAIDVDGFIAQCKLQFSREEVIQVIRPIEVASSPVKTPETTIPAVAISAGVLSAIVITTIVMIGVYYYNRPSINMKIQDSTQNFDLLYTTAKPDNVRKPVFTMKPETMFKQ